MIEWVKYWTNVSFALLFRFLYLSNEVLDRLHDLGLYLGHARGLVWFAGILLLQAVLHLGVQ